MEDGSTSDALSLGEYAPESSASHTPARVSYPFYLAAVFAALALAVVFQTARILCNRHNVLSFQLAFYALCFLWVVLRAVFFALTSFYDTPVTFFFLYSLPTNVQFATFSLLVLYLVQRTHYAQWPQIRRPAFLVYAGTNVLLLAVHAALAIVAAATWSSATHNAVETASSSIFSIIFFLLVILLAVYAVKLPSDSSRIDPSFPKYPTPTMMSGAAYVIFSIYTFRSIWDVLTATNIEAGAWEQALVVLFYLIWEVAPIVIVLVLFGSVGKVKYRPIKSRVFGEAPVITPAAKVEQPRMLPSPSIGSGISDRILQPGHKRQGDLRHPLLADSKARGMHYVAEQPPAPQANVRGSDMAGHENV
eukprot:m51a1_g3472 hypothetical protein (362) ;mRNA; r:747850-749373